MIDTTLRDEIVAIVRNLGRVAPQVIVNDESRLIEDLAIDSLDLVNVIIRIQDRFDVVIDDEVVPNLRRVVDLADYVVVRRKTAAA